MGRYWLGVPDAPLWLVWAGEEYRGLMPSVLTDGVIRTAECPDDWEAIRANRIDWPRELLRVPGDYHDERNGAPVIPDLTG
jgi:hypothetical protein